MEEEIDLRAYIAVLLKYKFWIGGLAVVATLVAMGVSFTLPPTYEATALVVITKPRYTMQFDPRFATMDNIQLPYNAYPDLAVGDEIISRLIDDLSSKLKVEEQSVRVVRGMLEAKAGSDPSIVRLTVRNGDPARAACIANHWAALFVAQVNDLYGQSEQELAFFEDQLVEATKTLSKAEQELIDFQAHNEAAILNQQLNDKQASLKEYLDIARSVRLIIQDAKSLQDRLRAQDASAQVSLGDELTALLLEIDVQSTRELPIQLQITGQQGLTDKTVGEQIAILDALIHVLEDKLVTMAHKAESLEPDILNLQESLEQANTKEERLALAKNVAKETVLTLSRKVAEAQIATQDTTGEVRLASGATMPDTPVSPRKMLNTAVAGALGLFVGVFGAFAIEYWREERPELEQTE